MRALRFHAAKDLRVETIGDPERPGKGQVLDPAGTQLKILIDLTK